MDLAKQKCEPCEIGGNPLGSEAIKIHQAMISTVWVVKGDATIERDFKFKNFEVAMSFVNDVARLAEAEGHHPDMYIFYNHVKISLSTHAVNGLSLNDFIIAKKIEPIAEKYKAKE